MSAISQPNPTDQVASTASFLPRLISSLASFVPSFGQPSSSASVRSSPYDSSPKIIAIIGGTGAQGLEVIRHLLEKRDGQESPYKIRVLTRNLEHRRAIALKEMGVELVKGSITDLPAIEKLFDGAYGAFVNIDTFSVGAAAEIHASFQIWEIAQIKHVHHYVFSSLDYSTKIGGSMMYDADQYNPKGRFAEFLKTVSSSSDGSGPMWSVLTTGPYLDLLRVFLGPLNIRADGTRVYGQPMGTSPDARYPLQSRSDIGWWARWMLDNPTTASGLNLPIASALVSPREIAETLTRVTGIPAVYEPLSMDAFFALWSGEIPVASDDPKGKSWEQNFRESFALWRDGAYMKRDMDWIAKTHPGLMTLEKWMRETGYNGTPDANFTTLKNVEDEHYPLTFNSEKAQSL